MARWFSVDLVAWAGLLCVAGGAWWIYRPAGLITLGVGLCVWAAITARASGGT